MLELVFLRVLEMSWRAGWCVLGVLGVRAVLRSAPRRYLYGLWAVVAFRLVCPISVGTEFSLFNLEPEWGRETEALVGTEGSLTSENLEEAGNVAVREYGEMKTGSNKAGFALQFGSGWEYVWIMGVAGFLGYFAVSLWKLRGRVRMAVRTSAVSWGAGEEASSWRKGSLAVYECEGIGSPFAMGIWKPRIYLPWGLSGEPRRMVLLHEQYHIRRGDHLVKCAAFVLLSVYWFHPLIWAAWFGMCRDMEMSCDEKVLRRLGEGSGKKYSQTLLTLAAERPIFPGQAPGFGELDVKRRIRHALNFRTPALWAGAAALLAVAATVLILGTDGIGEEPEAKTVAEQLYEAKNPYIGDVSAEGRLLRKIYEALGNNTAAEIGFKVELQTSEEPYEFHFLMEEGQDRVPEDAEMEAVAALMLALTDNLGVVKWTLVNPQGISLPEGMLDIEGAEKLLNIEDIKGFGSSPEQVQRLLGLLNTE